IKLFSSRLQFLQTKLQTHEVFIAFSILKEVFRLEIPLLIRFLTFPPPATDQSPKNFLPVFSARFGEFIGGIKQVSAFHERFFKAFEWFLERTITGIHEDHLMRNFHQS